MKRFHAREMALLLGPMALLAGVAWWRSNEKLPRRAAPKPVWRLEAKSQKRAALPFQVRRGLDTRVSFSLAVKNAIGQRANTKLGRWWLDVRVVERDAKGKETRLWLLDGINSREIELITRNTYVPGGGYSYSNTWHGMELRFPVRLFGKRKNALEFRVDAVWRPVTNKNFEDMAKPGEVARQRELPDALHASIRVPLQEQGQTLPAPVASTDPLFDVRSVNVKREISTSQNEEVVKFHWHIFWRGPRPAQNHLSALKTFYVIDETGFDFGPNSNGLLVQHKKGTRHFELAHEETVECIQRRALERGSKRLWLQGWFSVNGAWPKFVNIEIPRRLWTAPLKPSSTKAK